MASKVVIERQDLGAFDDSSAWQKIATVYIDGREYRVYAPPKASGDIMEWYEHLTVQQPSPIGFGGDIGVDATTAMYVKKLVKEEFDRLDSESPRVKKPSNELDSGARFYHVRVHIRDDANIEVKFDLTRAELQSRILERYQNLQAVVIGGRTIGTNQIERIEVFETLYPSSQFEPMTKDLARRVPHDCFAGESDVKDITDEVITTPSFTVLPQKTDAIELLCERFDIVAKQLRKRREQRPTLDVGDEYDVQDLMHALLRIFFEDVRPEEWAPSYAGKATRMDFLLPNEQVVIEVKKTRQGLGAKELGTELIEDITRYKVHPSCKRLICFVYDPESRVANPRGIESDLSRSEGDFSVKVIIAP